MKVLFFLAIIFGLVLVAPIFAYVGPVAYQTEQVYADYNTDGSLSSETYPECSDNSNPCRFGFLEVALPNTNDTLQTVRINLSGTTDTNLNSKEVYKATVSSSSAIWAKTKLYVNDSVFGDDQNYYKITNANKAPAIEFNVTSYSNEQGGHDLYDHDNIGSGGSTNNMTFVITAHNPSTSKNLTNVEIVIQFDTDTNGDADAVNITYTSSGSRSSNDGADGYYDKITWSGDINAGGTQTFTIYANIIETDNFADGTTSINLDSASSDKGVKSSYSQTSTLTGLTIAYKYARGPVRQGIDMAETSGGGAWDIRGFITILAKNSTEVNGNVLTYNISSWAIYNVSASTGDVTNKLQEGTFSPSNFTADYGRLYTTDPTYSNDTSRVHITGTKPYVASSFNWHIIWNDTNPDNYVSYINTTLDLPTLYKIDMVPTKTTGGYLAIESATTFNITDKVIYQGDDNAPGKKIVILSVVPRNTTSGSQRSPFDIDETSIIVSWYNTSSSSYQTLKTGTGTTNGVTVTVTDPSGDNNGLVNVTIPDLSLTNIGKYLENGEKIKLFYEVSSPSNLQLGDIFNFTGNSTITTQSGTPETEDLPAQTMSTSGRQLIGYKDLWVPDPANPTLVNGSLVAQVFGSEITGIKFVDYVPLGTDFACSRASVTFCNSTDGSTWSCGVSEDYNVTDKGTITLSDGTKVHACEYTNGDKSGWTLSSGAAVKILYQINITQSGLYEIPMELAGFDPALGKRVFSTVYGVVRVTVPSPMIEPIIKQTDFLTARTITVGNPVAWVKEFDVYNPNQRWVESEFKIDVFEDTTDGFVSYLNKKGERIDEKVIFKKENGTTVMVWKTKLAPLETRNYDIRILTPPVLETDRDVEVIKKLEYKMVELKMSIFLRSLAMEDYENVAINLPISRDNILSVKDGLGNSLSYTGGEGLTTILINKFPAKALKEINIRYKQSYPKIIITPDKERYSLNSTVTLDILVIHGGEEINNPYLETEVYTPEKNLVYSNIQDLGKLDPIDKTSISERFRVPIGAPTGTYLAESRLRSDLAILATGTGNFYIVGTTANYGNLLGYLTIFFAIILLYVSVKRFYIIKKQNK